MLFRPTSLLQHPFPDVSRTVQDRDALFLTCIEKTNTFEIDEIQFLQIQNDWRLAALDFGFDLIQVPKSKFAAEPNPPLDLFNPQRHLPTGSRNGSSLSTTWASSNRLHSQGLLVNLVLIFQEFLFDEESAVGL